jgi:ankyrin repeat protein
MLVFEKKVNVNCLHVPLNETALIKAAERGNAEIVQWLLSEGKADVTLVDTKHQTALHFAAEKGHTNACAVLLKHGADVNAPEKRQKYTPLHLAAGKGRDKVVELLLESGAEIQVRVASSRGGVAFASLTLHHVCAVPGHGRGRKHCTAQGGRCRHGEGGGTLDRQARQRDCHEQGAWVGGGEG